jgi:hypothetical protein
MLIKKKYYRFFIAIEFQKYKKILIINQRKKCGKGLEKIHKHIEKAHDLAYMYRIYTLTCYYIILYVLNLFRAYL